MQKQDQEVKENKLYNMGNLLSKAVNKKQTCKRCGKPLQENTPNGIIIYKPASLGPTETKFNKQGFVCSSECYENL